MTKKLIHIGVLDSLFHTSDVEEKMHKYAEAVEFVEWGKKLSATLEKADAGDK